VLLRADIDALPIQENKRNLKREKSCSIRKYRSATCLRTRCSYCNAFNSRQDITGKQILKLTAESFCFWTRGGRRGQYPQILTYIEEEHLKIDGALPFTWTPVLTPGNFIAQQWPGYGWRCRFFSYHQRTRRARGRDLILLIIPLDCFVSIYEAVNNIRLKHISPFESFTFSIGQLSGGTRGNVIARDITFGGSGRFF